MPQLVTSNTNFKDFGLSSQDLNLQHPSQVDILITRQSELHPMYVKKTEPFKKERLNQVCL